MAGPTLPRKLALEVLRQVRGGDLVDRALERVAAGVGPRDRPWLQELLYGTFRLRGRLDYLLGQRVRSGLSSLHPDVLDVLRLGAFQLLEMGSVPPYAAISQSVELVRTAGVPRAAGLVNGVLHTLQRDRDRLRFPDRDAEPAAFLAAWGSHPEWLVERWLRLWGFDATLELVEANNRRPELFLRPIGQSPQSALDDLAAAGIGAEPVELFPDSLRVLPPHAAAAALAATPAVVQDPAAATVVRFAAVPPGAVVLDLCSAPGGKAAGAADTAARVVAADLSLGRLGRLRENLQRCGLEGRVHPVVADARMPSFREGDLVLLDAPCTGTGTLRRHPDGRWRVDPADLRVLAALQAELIDAAASLVRPGGFLVYSTCSLEPEENQEQVSSFLSRNPNFVRAPADAAIDSRLLDAEGSLLVLPQRAGVDGSFAARLKRLH